MLHKEITFLGIFESSFRKSHRNFFKAYKFIKIDWYMGSPIHKLCRMHLFISVQPFEFQTDSAKVENGALGRPIKYAIVKLHP